MKRTDPLVERYTSSILLDYRLARYDVEGSIAHAMMLGRCRIISAAQSRRYCNICKAAINLLPHYLLLLEGMVWANRKPRPIWPATVRSLYCR